MEEQRKEIELRSERVRNIVGQIPPASLRYGITIIGLSLVMLVAVLSIIPYQPSSDTTITISQDSTGNLHYSATIPTSELGYVSKIDKITANTNPHALPADFKIVSLSDSIHLNGGSSWQIATIAPNTSLSQKAIIEGNIRYEGKILFEKRSLLKWIMRRK